MSKLSHYEKSSIFLALYVGAILAANLAGGKLTVLFGKPLSVAILALPIAYVVLSAVNEAYGTRIPRSYVLAAITAQIVVLIMLAIALFLPQGPREIFPGFTEHYVAVFSTSTRIIIGSVIAFLTSQLYTVWVFDKLKKKTQESHLWLRYNAATISGQLIDTFLFMFIAFYRGDFGFTFSIALTYFLFKSLAVIISTPFFYGAVGWLKLPPVEPPEEPLRVPVQVPQGQKQSY